MSFDEWYSTTFFEQVFFPQSASLARLMKVFCRFRVSVLIFNIAGFAYIVKFKLTPPV